MSKELVVWREEPEDRKIRLRLVYDDNSGGVNVCTVGSNGKVQQRLANFSLDGMFRFHDVSLECPLPLDNKERIVDLTRD